MRRYSYDSSLIAYGRLGCYTALLLASAVVSSHAMYAAGTVKSKTTGQAIQGAYVVVQDSANLNATTDGNGAFKIKTTGTTPREAVAPFSFRQDGRELYFTNVQGLVNAQLVSPAGAILWEGRAMALSGECRLPFSLDGTTHSSAILTVRANQTSHAQVVLLDGGSMRAGSFLGTADLAGRSLANPPILKVTKSGYRDTTYAMKASTDTTIQIVLADTIPTPPVSTTCKLPPSPAENGSGSFTNYWFGQGTWKENGYYQTACGYHGDEPSGQSSDKMNNLAFPQYFVAIPGNSSSDFNTNLMCGACVELTGQNGTKIVATVTDECPNDINAPCRANPNGHLDISYPGFSKLGFSVGNPTGTKWKYVICPVTGNVIFRSKPGNSNEFFIENTILPIKSVTISGTALTKTSYGAWHNGVNVSTKTLVITDYSDRSISYKVGTIAADQDVNTGLQFPACK